MYTKLKSSLPLIIAITLPILLIIGAFLSVLIPQYTSHPKYNFVYYTGANSYCVKNGLIQFCGYNAYPPPTQYYENGGSPSQPPIYQKNLVYPNNFALDHFYIYNMATHQSTPTTLQALQELNIDSSIQSKDGYTVVQGNNPPAIGAFGSPASSDPYGVYLDGNGTRVKLDNVVDSTNYYTFKFIGWLDQ